MRHPHGMLPGPGLGLDALVAVVVLTVLIAAVLIADGLRRHLRR